MRKMFAWLVERPLVLFSLIAVLPIAALLLWALFMAARGQTVAIVAVGVTMALYSLMALRRLLQ